MTTTTLPTGTWTIDAPATTVTVTVKKLGFLTVPATFDVTAGTIEIDDNDQISNVTISVAAASYSSPNAKRNEHIRSDDFLAADTYPEITFSCSEVTSNGETYTATGTVTIKGKATPANVTISAVSFDETKGSFTASATVDRVALGIDKFPTFFIARDLDLSVEAVATRTV
ncbi:MAG: YceI family protein [Acidimicrobiia bacterium]|nr:YceI family protein [Acidimicrobiia bacterium]